MIYAIDEEHETFTPLATWGEFYSNIIWLPIWMENWNKLEFLSVNMPTYDYKIWNDKFVEKFKDIPQNKHIR